MSFTDFISTIYNIYEYNSAILQKDQFRLRYGQIIMNELSIIWPDKYAQITNTEYDCFYDDSLAKKTLSKLENEWFV